jgi:hypothetical protein
MVHTWEMRTLWRRTGILLAGLAIAGSAGWPQTNRAAQSGTYAIAHWQSAADQAARKNPDARVLVVEISSGRCWRTRPAKRSRNLRTAPPAGSSRGSFRDAKVCLGGSLWGPKISLDGCEKYTPLTMQTTLSGHKLVWKGAKSERSLHGMGQVVFDRAGLGGIGAIQRFLQAHFCGFSARA